MKTISLVVGLLVMMIGLPVTALAVDASTSTVKIDGVEKVVYEPRVLVRTKWGDGPKEIGYHLWRGYNEETGKPYENPRLVAPICLSVDMQGVLYLLDGVHRRILKFSTEDGAFIESIDNIEIPNIENEDSTTLSGMHVDATGTIFIGYSTHPIRYYILDRHGKLVRRIIDKKDTDGMIAMRKKLIVQINSGVDPAAFGQDKKFQSEENRIKELRFNVDQLNNYQSFYNDPKNILIENIPYYLRYDSSGETYVGNCRVTGGNNIEESVDLISKKSLVNGNEEFERVRKKIVAHVYTDKNKAQWNIHYYWNDICIDKNEIIYGLIGSWNPKSLSELVVIKWGPRK